MAAASHQHDHRVIPPALRCDIEVRGTTRIVAVDGEIDLATAPELRDVIRQAFGGHPETLVIDLARVTFIDSSGLHALIDADRRSTAAGIRLIIVPAAADVHRPFSLAGLDQVLPFVLPPRSDRR
jgi:anti-sigma B factor antagonist